MKKTTTARKINLKAKKYKELLNLQKEVNKMLKESKSRLGGEHNAYKQALAKKKQFYKTRGIKTPAQFSAKNLKTSDVEAYKALLESIKGSTYLNKENYEKYHKANIQRLIDKGFAKDEKEALQAYSLINRYKELIQELAIPPSELIAFRDEMLNEYNIDEDDFIRAFVDVATYLKSVGDITDFFDLTEKYIDNIKAVDSLVDDGVGKDDILSYLQLLGTKHFGELVDDYNEYVDNNGDADFSEFAESWLNG